MTKRKHEDYLRKCNEVLASVGLSFFHAHDGEVLLIVDDYPRLKATYREYKKRPGSATAEFGIGRGRFHSHEAV